MKIIALIVALNLAASFAMPVVAAEIPTTKADCEQAGMKWKEWAPNEKCRFQLGGSPRFLLRSVMSLALSGLARLFSGV